jgi:hypothetical protein
VTVPTITKRTVLGVNGTANPLQGDQFEYLPFDAYVEVGIAADANGVLATVYSGSDLLQDEGPVTLKTINVPPVYPDDFMLTDYAAAGDRLNIKLRDTSGVARTVMTLVKITPV